MIFKSGSKEINIYFLKEYHLDLLENHHIELSQLPYLPKIKNVSDEDCLDWLSFQRGVEYKYQKFSNTTYDDKSNILNKDINRTGVVYQTKYDNVINGTPSVKLENNFFYCYSNETLFILNSNNTVSSSLFTPVPGNLEFSIFQSLLSKLGYFELYSKENKNLIFKDAEEKDEINLGFVISKLIS